MANHHNGRCFYAFAYAAKWSGNEYGLIHNLNLHHICSSGTSDRNAGGDDSHIAVFQVAFLFSCRDGAVEENKYFPFLLQKNRTNTPGQIQLPTDFIFNGAADNIAGRTVSGNHPCGETGFGYRNNSLGVQVISCAAGCVADG